MIDIKQQIIERLQRYFKLHHMSLIYIDDQNISDYMHIDYFIDNRLDKKIDKNKCGFWFFMTDDFYNIHSTSSWTWMSIDGVFFGGRSFTAISYNSSICKTIRNRHDMKCFDDVRSLGDLIGCTSLEEIAIKLDLLGI
jgi:hypothetical protein